MRSTPNLTFPAATKIPFLDHPAWPSGGGGGDSGTFACNFAAALASLAFATKPADCSYGADGAAAGVLRAFLRLSLRLSVDLAGKKVKVNK